MQKLFCGFIVFISLNACQSNTSSSPQEQQNMNNTDWMKSTNVYEVNVRQYTKEGTFNAFAKELPRLKEMGVKTLWFMPVTPIAQKMKKGTMGSYYAAADYTSINPEFGTLGDFKILVKMLMRKDLK